MSKASMSLLLIAAMIFASFPGMVVANEYRAGPGFKTVTEVREFGNATVVVITNATEVERPISGGQGSWIAMQLNSVIVVSDPSEMLHSELSATSSDAGYQSRDTGSITYKLMNQTFPNIEVWQNLTLGDNEVCIRFWNEGYGDIRAEIEP